MQSLHYKRVNWVFRVGFLMVSADKISECSWLIVDTEVRHHFSDFLIFLARHVNDFNDLRRFYG